MLQRTHLLAALHCRREEFAQFEHAWQDALCNSLRNLHVLSGKRSEDVRQEVEAIRAPGALPSAELDEQGVIALRFGNHWRSHEEARRWAITALTDRVTFAVDGSQILPGREISMPVAAVQVACFENPHALDGSYRKEVDFSVITPAELLGMEGERPSATAEAIVSFRRFNLEVAALGDFLRKKQGWRERGERLPIGFFDGTLLMSYAQPRTKIQERYVNSIVELVKLSRDTAVPIVGFIDQSYARDIVNLLEAIAGTERGLTLYDAQLLHAVDFDGAKPALAAWGDRTIFCYCKREGLTEGFQDESGKPLVGFVYLQTTSDGPPARLDLPAWIYEAGLLNDVMDAVRAECVVGNGYPYAIETADAAAVITTRDRMQFLRAMQEFASRESLAFRISRKATSKVHRRQ